jgi:hypothetical protein
MSLEQKTSVTPLVYIHAAGGIGHALAADQPPPSLRAQAKQRFGPSLRQASRFIELSLLGVADCLQSLPAIYAQSVPVYVATGLGEVQKTMTLFATVTGTPPEPAAPFDFINAANNTAGFYVAKHFTGSGRNFTICDGDLSFESALQLALLEYRQAAANYVLVGGVDEAIASRAEYARRNAGAAPAGTIGEGSYWFVLSSRAGGAIGEVLHAEIFARHLGDDMDVNHWAASVARALRKHMPSNGTLQFLPGVGLDEQLISALKQPFSSQAREENNSIKSNSYVTHPTSSARTLSDWLNHTGDHGPTIDYAALVSRDSRDSQGRTAITLIRKLRR